MGQAALRVVPDVGETTHLQGKWRRIPGVATRHEVVVAIGALLALGKVVVVDGLLALPERGRIRMRLAMASVPKTREDRWAREDDALRAYCERIEPHETRSRKFVEDTAMVSEGSLFEATVVRGEPRKTVRKYVMRELGHGGPSEYDALIDRIFESGGLEWVLEEQRKRGKGAKRKGGKR